MRASPLLLAVPLLLTGCLGATEEVTPDALPDVVAPSPSLAFTAPVVLNSGGHGYEPSIRVGPDGTLYATAHKAALTHEGTRLASWLWYSTDDGATWNEMPSPGQLHDKLFAFEGDLAVDAEGRIYYVDTYAGDNTISRWKTGEDGPEWEWTRPLQGTTGVDDRPWLDAHGDGIVYYLGNNGAAVPALNDIAGGGGDASRIWFYRSVDGGLTWTPGHGFPDSGWCDLAASPADDASVYVGCSEWRDGNLKVVVYASHDRGDTWERSEVAPYHAGEGPIFPSISVDRGGNVYHAWIDDKNEDDASGRIHVARSTDGGATWLTQDVTPFAGAFGMVWITGGDAATAAVTFYGTPDLEPADDTEWHPYLLLAPDATAPVPEWHIQRLDGTSAGVGPFPPGDFFQNSVGPDNAVHVIFQREVGAGGTALDYAMEGYRNDILHVRQTAGPNLAVTLDVNAGTRA